jgi:hypothetical protein
MHFLYHEVFGRSVSRAAPIKRDATEEKSRAFVLRDREAHSGCDEAL